MAFMQADISRGDYFKAETRNGTEIVPADVVSLPFPFRVAVWTEEDNPQAWPLLARALRPYLMDPDGLSEVSSGTGWLARLSAPGYMDCTDWTAHNTEAEARAYLVEMYGDEEDPDEDE